MSTTGSNHGTDSTTDASQQTTNRPSETTTDKVTEETTTGSYQETTTSAEATNPTQTTDSNSETTTLPGETTTNSNGEETTTNVVTSRPPSTGNSSCPPLGEGQAHFVCPTGFRRHPQDCGLFYQCTQSPETSHLSIVTFNCPNGTVYDEDAIQCRDRTKNDNCASKSENATLLRGTVFDFEHESSPIVRNFYNVFEESFLNLFFFFQDPNKNETFLVFI